MIFTHTLKERGMWRGWLANGQSLELHRNRRGWSFGAGVLIHSNDDDNGDRMLCLKFWRFSAYIPMGVIQKNYTVGEEPEWSVFGSSEFGLWFRWRLKSRCYEWPGTPFTVCYEQQLTDGSWGSVFKNDVTPYTEAHDYVYTLKSGEAQQRTATISKRRHILARRGLHRIGWPKWVSESIDVQFSDEVGERSGSWKGGCIGCSYALERGETMLDALRRMERRRVFT